MADVKTTMAYFIGPSFFEFKNRLHSVRYYESDIVIRYKVYNEQHPRAGLNIQHVIYEQLARAGRNT